MVRAPRSFETPGAVSPTTQRNAQEDSNLHILFDFPFSKVGGNFGIINFSSIFKRDLHTGIIFSSMLRKRMFHMKTTVGKQTLFDNRRNTLGTCCEKYTVF
jgi:hypothetical protein